MSKIWNCSLARAGANAAPEPIVPFNELRSRRLPVALGEGALALLLLEHLVLAGTACLVVTEAPNVWL